MPIHCRAYGEVKFIHYSQSNIVQDLNSTSISIRESFSFPPLLSHLILLLYGNMAHLWNWCLWNSDREDTVLQRGRDVSAINAGWKAECACERSMHTFVEPVALFWFLLLLLWLRLLGSC